MNAAEVADAALALDEDERIVLIERLMESIDAGDPHLTPEAWESAWAEEVDQRLDDLEAGRTLGIPADDVYQRISERLKS